MNTKMKWFTAVSCAIVALSVCTACQDDDMNQQPTDPAANVHTYRIVADVDAASGGEGTRALTEDASSVLHSAWLQNDKMIAYCLNDKDKSTEKQYNLLTSATAGKGSKFDGTFKSVKAITASDEICFFYPGAASQGNGATINSTMRLTGDGKKKPFVYYEKQPTIKQTVELNLTEQDGTAETIGKKFDYQWAKAKPSVVNGTDVKVKSVKMQRQIAIWGLRFANDEGKILTSIDSVYISGAKSVDVFDLGTGKFIEDNVNDESDNIVLKPAKKGDTFTSAKGKYIYAATLPGTYARVLISVFVGNKCYAREYNNIKLEADKVYRTDVINMPQTVANPYVEVQGVKWATGNFIHYGVEGSGTDYWGIAPTQWWISKHHIKDAETGLWITSQFKSSPTSIPEDLDMFRYGDIGSATKVNVGEYKSGTKEIAQKYYAEGGPLKPEVTRDQAKYGDIVWYYTEKDNQKYRMPKAVELKKLYENANVIPAYCYSNYGLRIYGAFFYTNNGEPRKKTFPTRVNALYKYSNVTALVRANKGLFLPITGRREASNNTMGYRDMTYTAGAYGQYMSSTSSSTEMCTDFFFGPTEWNFDNAGKGYALAIRPVWDPSSSTTPNPVYPAFKDIH